MAERTKISFEVDKEYLLDLFREDAELKEFFKKQFSSYIQIHVNNIRNNMRVLNKEVEEEKMLEIALNYIKSLIEKEDMENMLLEVLKQFLKESFTNKKEPNIAIKEALKSKEVISIAKEIEKKLRSYYLLNAINIKRTA